MNNEKINEEILQKILPLPSQKIVTDRFAMQTNQAGDCGGTCSSGSCKTSF